ncbi:conjugative transfer signal peptidase TraF (plasmid) [Rhizobium ruizarguesonis]|uniref:Conjugative transfer signal peptidase TraF n=1 Tax=Rhizobium leguminosarum TaxID=384 RepID=A0A7M3DJL9_RHILE|nr:MULTISPECIES: conjugative transfer signal peptidase TraF [Rhizobium]TAU15683.1 conjugative transfer signal peptidase TraF [Rhizobium ruizarguesonis]TAU35371.1 conjugative transfer signal peptidase TraF [Rhizobium leguminosarum]TAU37567.1 conjugative transfer signal peptidase TraF [Rhizobium ruizarguesonis]TAU46340.1 conjugative transfer signal peptidase TraF [Rhizobium ruizarguesonis]TAU59087.1 conjugative transfer signal peptidase TraF [Rhizobium ruizarguesonis]
MTGAATRRSMTTQQRRSIVVLSMAAVAAILLAVTAVAGAYRINLTPSEPLGLWRIIPLHRPAAVDDLLFICPPETAAMRAARARGYLRSGSCPGGVAPLIKTVIAVAGQHVEIGASVDVDGREVFSSSVAQRDGKGRPLAPFMSGTIPPGYVFLHSAFPGSYDSRYFGPLPASGILGLAQEVFTYVP